MSFTRRSGRRHPLGALAGIATIAAIVAVASLPGVPAPALTKESTDAVEGIAERLRRGETVTLRKDTGPAWKGERISLSLRDADLAEVLRSFAKLGKIQLVLDPRVKGKVTLELENVPWDQALYVILKTHRLSVDSGPSGGSSRLWSIRPGGGPRR